MVSIASRGKPHKYGVQVIRSPLIVYPAKSKGKLIWYLGGLPGGFTVLLAAITVNSPLSLSGSIILMITGQIIFSLMVDSMGWFGVTKRKIVSRDLMVCVLLISDSSLLIMGRY
ncbi:TPA: DMT family transporter [Providencia rettgeri]